MIIEVLSKPVCSQCDATKRYLKTKQLDYVEKDVTTDADALATARSLNYMSAPVVLVKNAEGEILEHWSGFQIEKLGNLANQLVSA